MDGDTLTGLQEMLEECYAQLRQRLTEAGKRRDTTMTLAVARELRLHLALAHRVRERAARPAEVQAFEDTVMDVLAEADPKLRIKVIEEIERRSKGTGSREQGIGNDDEGDDDGNGSTAEDADHADDEEVGEGDGDADGEWYSDGRGWEGEEASRGGRGGPPRREMDGDAYLGRERSPPEEPEYLTTREAADVLGVSMAHVNHLGRHGALPRVRVGSHDHYERTAVCAYAEQRARQRDKARIDERVWGPRDRPVEHTDLLTTRQAAQILGLGRKTVASLVLRGVLPGYQAKPHTCGSRIMVPTFYVERLAERPAYLRHRRAAESRRPPETAVTRGSEEYGIAPVALGERRKVLDRNHGEFYSTSQAAGVLGIGTKAVWVLASRGRLKAHRRKRRVIQSGPQIGQYTGGNRWLFFRKEDVHALLEDSAYRERREAYRRGKSPERQAERFARDLAACVRANRETRPVSAFDDLAFEVPRVSYEKLLR